MKRFLDFTVSLLAIIVLLPLFAIISVMVLIDSGSPVIFKQIRVGRGGKHFYIYKFRTMEKNTRNVASKELAESEGNITAIGRFLRKTSLDELPQLFNILNGTMSFVGPRPLIPEEEEIHKLREEYNVYSVRPGMTGLAQINGRDDLNFEEKSLYDKEYVENHSILYDFRIMIKTVFVVISGKGNV